MRSPRAIVSQVGVALGRLPSGGFDTYFDDFDLSKYKAISLGAIQRPGNDVDHVQWLESASGRFFGWAHLYVIADVYSRQGRHADAEQEAARGRALERKAPP